VKLKRLPLSLFLKTHPAKAEKRLGGKWVEPKRQKSVIKIMMIPIYATKKSINILH